MNKKDTPAIGVMIILISAVMSCCGQLCWKLSGSGTHALIFLLAGFALYGIGALAMIVAFKFGDVSRLHPMLSLGYIGSLFLGYFFLDESVTARKIIGIVFIFAGLVLLNLKNGGENNETTD